MQAALHSAQCEPEEPQYSKKQMQSEPQKWLKPLFWAALALFLLAAVLMRLYHLDAPFDRDGYDEGVYWQSLRAMFSGQSLYHSIFYSQPPVFLLSTFPIFALLGHSLWSARASIALISLLGFAGAYLLGKVLAGRAGGLAALLLLLVNPLYLVESQTIQAEGPSVALTLLAIGFAFLWYAEPTGRRGLCWAALTGITVALSIFCKLLGVATLVPVALLMLTRGWQISRGQSRASVRGWLPIIVGVGLALLTILAVVLPFAGSFQAFWSSVITFHQVAAQILPGTLDGNYHIIKSVFLSLLGASAGYGLLVALLRKDWRVLPLLAWLLSTFVLLLRQYPLFPHHLVALIPPLIALAALGVAKPDLTKGIFTKMRPKPFASLIPGLAVLLVLLTSAFNLWQDYSYYQSTAASSLDAGTQQGLQVARDLRQAIAPDQWVITDGQFIAALADRSTPPSLVDTSSVRIATNYVTLAQLEQAASDPRVHAVLFYTDRFSVANTADFRAWVAQHFHLLHTYGPGQELWVR